ncbi:MAG TPA: hypothetical protein VH257_09920 [Chloroflexota bacterium]|nr:hypothetical protein [Chloroflexota bacterium]
MLPLEGIRILDPSRLAPGPYCTMLLIEQAGEGSGARGNPAQATPGEAAERASREIMQIRRST